MFGKAGCTPKLFGSFLLSLQGPILNKLELTHKFKKTAQKVV